MEKPAEVVGFSPDLAIKIADMARQTEGSRVSVPSVGSPQKTTYGSVSTAAAVGSGTNPTAGKFNMWDMLEGGTPTSTDPFEIDFTNPYPVSFPTNWVGIFVDTGLAWVPVLGSGTCTAYGTLSSALATTDTTASVTLDSNSPLYPSGSITATNWCEIEAPINTKCIVNLQGTEWILMQISC